MTSAKQNHLSTVPVLLGMRPASSMRALIYARFSIALQSAASIDDQVRVCRERAAAEGWTIVGVHADYAISGAVRERPGLNALLAALAAGDVDIVLSEALDRLSRDQEDIAAIHKRVLFAGARIVTTSEGDIGELHIGLKGTMSALFRRDLADKVRRGQVGRVLAGASPGGLAYGYRRVARLGPDGEPIRGLREIDEDQAAIVRRIFSESLEGRPPREIALRLNQEGVLAPKGGEWTAGTIGGDRRRRNGILWNDIYAGRIVYNKTRRTYTPDTRERRIRLRPEAEWKIKEKPELRIVDDANWTAMVARRAEWDGVPAGHHRRPRLLLSGLAVCGACGARVIVRGTNKSGAIWGCGRHLKGGNCANGRTVTNALLETRVLSGLEDRLLDPDLVAAYVKEWHEALARREADAARGRARLERKRATAAAREVRLVRAVTEGGEEFAAIRGALSAARVEISALDRQLAELGASSVIALHPGVTADYRKQVSTLRHTLASGDEADRHAAFHQLRALISRVIVTPATGRGTHIEIEGRLKALLDLATGQASPSLCVNAGAA